MPFFSDPLPENVPQVVKKYLLDSFTLSLADAKGKAQRLVRMGICFEKFAEICLTKSWNLSLTHWPLGDLNVILKM